MKERASCRPQCIKRRHQHAPASLSREGVKKVEAREMAVAGSVNLLYQHVAVFYVIYNNTPSSNNEHWRARYYGEVIGDTAPRRALRRLHRIVDVSRGWQRR